MFAIGQLVKFAAPITTAEESERFTVLELRGDRILVQFVCDLTIKPTSVYSTADMISAD